MNPSILLRIASVLAMIFFLAHTLGGMLNAPSHGPEETALLEAMKSQRFDFAGSMRGYWDFYFGFGLMLSVNSLLQSVLFWQLGAFARKEPARARPFIASFLAAYLAMAVLAWRFLVVVPMLLDVATAICLALAFISARPSPSAP